MKQNLVTAQAVHLPSATEAPGQLLTCIPQAQQMAAVSLLHRVRLIQIWGISCNTDSGASAAGAGASAEGAGDSAAAQILVRLLQHRGSCIRCSTGAGTFVAAQGLVHNIGWCVCCSSGVVLSATPQPHRPAAQQPHLRTCSEARCGLLPTPGRLQLFHTIAH